jgi:DHA2 family multidrug resistance protein
MLATFMEVLDTSVANVALPHIAGNLSASTEESTWVLTSYLVSNAIILPATNWLGRYFGRKRFLIICIIIFTASSALCGAAASLGLLIVARILQGAGGGALQPIAQSVLMESFPPENAVRPWLCLVWVLLLHRSLVQHLEVGSLTTIPGVGFSTSIPIGILAVFMANMFIEDPPISAINGLAESTGWALRSWRLAWGRCNLSSTRARKKTGSLHHHHRSPIFAVVTLVAFVIWELSTKEPIVDLRVLKNRNFSVGTSLMTVLGVVLYGTIALLPLSYRPCLVIRHCRVEWR